MIAYNLARSMAALMCLLCVLALLMPGSVRLEAADPPAIKRFLVLHDSGHDIPFRAEFDPAFYDALRAASAGPIEVIDEAIESLPQDAPAQQQAFRDYLKTKYAGRKIDVVIAVQDAAASFARRNRDIFGYAPVVAFIPTSNLEPDEDVTGLHAASAIRGTVELARHVQPEATRVFVVDGFVPGGDGIEAELRRHLSAQNRRLELSYLRDLPMTDLIERIRTIPNRSIVLFVGQTMWDPTKSINQLEGLAEVVRASPVPIFVVASGLIGLGPVGGYVWQVKQDAGRLVEMAVKIAGGARPRDLPPGEATLAPTFDWRQLQRWGIPGSRLPANSVLLFRPSSFFELYRGYVIGGSVVFIAQFTLIVGLLIQRVRRRRAEAEARTNADRYRSVVETQTDLVCRFLPDSTLTFVNDAYCRFWNKSREQLLGTKFIELVPEASREEVLARIGRLQYGAESNEHPVVLADGTVGRHHWVNHAIVDTQGRLVELQGVGHDITDRWRAEEALRQAEARNTAILKAIPDMMFVLLRDGTYVDYHARDPELLFAPPDTFIGKKVREIMPPSLADVMMDGLERAWESDEPVVVEYELPMDERRFYEARIVKKSSERLLCIVRDVTETKRASELNHDLARRLIASQEHERQRIARELHDDVSQRIALLNIEIDEVAAQVETARSRTRLHRLSALAGELASDVHNLSYELHPSKLQAIGLVGAIQSLCRDASKQRDLHVAFTHAAIPKSVDSNVSLCLYRIAQEALHNIVRHSQAREAQVSVTCNEGEIALRIEDSGIGFDPKEVPYAGLGLLSMKERAAVVKGELALHASPGGGTRIGVRIPLEPREIDSSSPFASV